MNLDELLLSDEELADLTPPELERYAEILATAKAAVAGPTAWRDRARPEQLPPDGEWSRLFLRGGRGSGKTWSGAHILAEEILADPLRATDGPGQWAVIAPTYGDARDTCIEAESGLLAALGTTRAEVVAGRSPLVQLWNRSLGELRLRNGSVVYADGADDGALRIQGTNLRGVWADEVGLWRNWRQAWDESIAFALRKGAARLIATATPKSDMGARELVGRLLNDPAVISRRLRTEDNRANLSDSFWARVSLTAGSRLSRQELEGELLEDVEGALWRRDWIENARVDGPPHGGYRAVVVGLDPADGGAQGAEQALTVAGAGVDGGLYVIASEGMRDTPLAWLSHAVRVAQQQSARIVVERNHGGAFLVGLLEQAIAALGIRVPYQVVNARTGKLTRAEPVAALYEQGKVHHIGVHAILEEQLVNYTGGPGERSPDRCDATVWALLELMGYARRSGGPSAGGDAIPYRDDVRGVSGGAVPWAGSTPWEQQEIVLPAWSLNAQP